MKLYFAPMEGITGYVFRNAYSACYSGIDTYFTPFLSNPVLNHIELGDVLPEHNEGLRVIPQILTNRADTFVTITNTLKDFGYTEVNLNLGCPSGTVVAKGRGAGALREPKELDRLLDRIFSDSPLPVSVKTRIGIHSENEWEDILEIYRKYPITELIIHPRVQKQFYKGEVCMEAYREAYLTYGLDNPSMSQSNEVISRNDGAALRNEAIRTPGNGSIQPGGEGPGPSLCYNGDIRTVTDAKRILTEYPKTSALMLGRGLLWDPELAERILHSQSPDDHGNLSGSIDTFGTTRSIDTTGSSPVNPDLPRLRHFLDLLYEGYRKEMDREGPALMKLKELWAYLKVYAGLTDAAMRPLWKAKTLAEYRDVVRMLLR